MTRKRTSHFVNQLNNPVRKTKTITNTHTDTHTYTHTNGKKKIPESLELFFRCARGCQEIWNSTATRGGTELNGGRCLRRRVTTWVGRLEKAENEKKKKKGRSFKSFCDSSSSKPIGGNPGRKGRSFPFWIERERTN